MDYQVLRKAKISTCVGGEKCFIRRVLDRKRAAPCYGIKLGIWKVTLRGIDSILWFQDMIVEIHVGFRIYCVTSVKFFRLSHLSSKPRWNWSGHKGGMPFLPVTKEGKFLKIFSKLSGGTARVCESWEHTSMLSQLSGPQIFPSCMEIRLLYEEKFPERDSRLDWSNFPLW